MRVSASMSHGVLLLALASPALLLAQFQQPTGDELKMTVDAKAPGAAAVYLNLEETTDDGLHFHSFYARIKVLQEKGKELATVEIPYQRGNYKVDDIKGRTIHPDGTIVPLTGKPEDLLISKSGDKQIGRKVFNLPSVEVGSIIEYRYSLRYDDNQFSSPMWEIQRPYFIHKAHYAFTPFKGFMKGTQNATSRYLTDEKGHVDNNLMWWTILPPGITMKQDSWGHFNLDLSDVPASPDEEWMSPIWSELYKVLFYYTYASNGQEFWVAETKSWSKDMDRFAEPSKPIREAVAGLIAPGDSDREKAVKLYKAVQALDNTDFSRKKEKSELKQLKLKAAKHAEDTWAQKSGSSQDIALLYLAMTRAAGLTGYATKVVDRERGRFDPAYMNFDQLDDMLVILNLDGKELPVDPGEKMCPFETVHWRHSGAGGARQSSDGRFATTTPEQGFKTNTLLRTGTINLGADGGVTGSINFVMAGQRALRWRQAALENDVDELKKSFDRWLEAMAPEGVQAHIDHFLGLDDPEVNLIAVVKVEGTLGSVTSKRLFVPAFFFETRKQPFIGEEKRQEPVDMHYAEQISDQIVYRLPAGMTVESAPANANVSWPQHAVLGTKTVSAAGQVTVARQFIRAFTFAKPEEYQDLRGFYQKVAGSDQQQVVLTTASAVKGN